MKTKIEIRKIAQVLDKIFPKQYQESYDNCGLIVGSPDMECTGILTTLDITPEIIEEAFQKNCNLIVSHHPVIFRGIKSLLDNTINNKSIMLAIEKKISIYAAHTSLDNRFAYGLNSHILYKLGLEKVRSLKENINANTVFSMGLGAIGKLPEPKFAIDFLHELRIKLNMTCPIRHSNRKNELIDTIAICTGAGSFALEFAKNAGAQLFLTGDVGYHTFFEETDIFIADIGHYDSEKYAGEVISNLIRVETQTQESKIADFPFERVLISETEHVAIKFC